MPLEYHISKNVATPYDLGIQENSMIERISIDFSIGFQYNKSIEILFIKGEGTMKIQNISDIDKFFKVVDSCAGKVELVTGEGDRLNLKSKLCQYVSMANIFSNGEIPELEIIAYEKEDIDKLIAFMLGN